MRAHVMLVAEEVVGDGADLEADVVFLDHIEQNWVVDQRKTMTNSLAPEQNSIEEGSVRPHVTLARMQEEVHLVCAYSRSRFDDELDVLVRSRIFVFLTDQVEADAHVSELQHFFKQGNLPASVLNSEDLQAAVDNLYLEHGEAFLQRLLNALKNSDFLLDRDCVVVVVEEAAEDVAELNNSDHLLDALAAHVVEDLLEEVGVVVQFEAEVKFWLEVYPAVAGLGEGRCEDDLFFKVIVERLGARPILAELDALDIAGFSASILRNKE